MDFYTISTRELKNGNIEVFPDWKVGRSKDLMVRGRSFYAIWDEALGLWSTDEYDVQRLVDEDLHRYVDEESELSGRSYIVKALRSYTSASWTKFRNYMNIISDNSHQLDENLTFANTEVKQTDYVSRRLPYALEEGDISAWDDLIGTLYSEEERAKIEWAIGAIIAGDSKTLQKFLVLYGPAGTGKSTVLNILEKLFQGYTTSFEAKALGSNGNNFATEAFRHNPLVAIQHDGDLSKIEDNTKLNSIIAHEDMMMNEKFKPSYTARVNAILWMGTNQPVRISDARSGIIRRLIDVHPTGNRIPISRYTTLMSRIDFELGAIGFHCLKKYQAMGKNYYNGYRPLEMMFQTDVFFNFIEANYDIFKAQESISLRQAYALYKEYCAETGVERPMQQHKVRAELQNYFDIMKERGVIDGREVRSIFSGFNTSRFKSVSTVDQTFSLVLEHTESLFDTYYADYPAQYANEAGTPSHRWDNVKTCLAQLDTRKLHFTKVPDNHIVIDFDLKDENGRRDLERNLAEAATWPATYGELSQSGNGVHLHYVYTGVRDELATNYSPGIEIKVFTGNASLRRRRSRCNDVPINTISTGLPLKEKKVLNADVIQSEKGLRALIERNLKKEIHPGTKSSVDFIHKILEDAYDSGLVYDVTDLRPRIVAFANNSRNQPLVALKTVQTMKFKSEEPPWEPQLDYVNDRRVFFDVEVYPNLFVICWKYAYDLAAYNAHPDWAQEIPIVTKMINPTPQEVESLFSLKLIGFNNRRYDNHILYARYLGYNNEQLYKLSQKIIDGNVGAMFGEAYDLSYTDIYDFSSKKQSLKKFQVELGFSHMELAYPWDQPVPEENWDKVVEYCANDVITTEMVFNARLSDFTAREILAELSGLSVNDTTQKHTAKIIFDGARNPQEEFVYTDLSKEFPGYVYDMGKSTYKGEETGEGGYVYAEPGMYQNVSVLDISSMHPTSICELNLFGRYTKNFAELKSARMAIKHKEYEKARKLLDGKLAKFITSDSDSEALSYALKIVINIVYGLTSAKFDNPFRDRRNKDNIVAKRGALFMVDLKLAVQEQGYKVIHIKTDSIKIPDATEEIIEFVQEFGKKYGYEFENEGIYDKMCLVNESTYIARKGDKWEAVGAQFQHPVVFKTLFDTEAPRKFEDQWETKQVTKGSMWIDFDGDRYFIGRIGRFVPVTERSGGGTLYRVVDDKDYAVSGTKGYHWVEAGNVSPEQEIDDSYFDKLVDEAKKTIEKFGSFDWFVAE